MSAMKAAKLLVFGAGVLAILIAAGAVLGSGVLGDTASELAGSALSRPGIGIKGLSLLNLLLAYVLVLMLLDQLPVWQKLAPKVQGIVTFILTLLGLIVSIVAVVAALQLLLLMVALLFAPPFGTIAYFALWGSFDTDASRTLLAFVMGLQIVGVIAILAVNPTLLKNIWLMLLIGSSLLMTFVLGILHAFPPSFLVSITDAIGAIVAGILSAIWMIIFLVGAVIAVIRAIRSLVPA